MRLNIKLALIGADNFEAGQAKLNSIDAHDTNKCWGDK